MIFSNLFSLPCSAKVTQLYCLYNDLYFEIYNQDKEIDQINCHQIDPTDKNILHLISKEYQQDVLNDLEKCTKEEIKIDLQLRLKIH